MELRYLLGIIRANLRFLGAVSVVACLLALTATYILPERFESSTTVLIRPEKKPSFTASSPTIMDYPVSFAIPAESMSQTYASLMTNEAMAMKIVDRPVSVPDWFATIFAALGIDPADELYDGDRPVPITDRGRPVQELFT